MHDKIMAHKVSSYSAEGLRNLVCDTTDLAIVQPVDTTRTTTVDEKKGAQKPVAGSTVKKKAATRKTGGGQAHGDEAEDWELVITGDGAPEEDEWLRVRAVRFADEEKARSVPRKLRSYTMKSNHTIRQ